MRELLTVAEVAVFLGVHPQTVREAIHSGEIEAVEFGNEYRIRESHLIELLGTRHRLLTAEDVGKILKLHPETVRRYAREEKIKTVDFGSWRTLRFRKEDVDEFVAELVGGQN